MITLVAMTDGRAECVTKSVSAAMANLQGPITTRLMHDDSGDPANNEMLWDLFGPHNFVILAEKERQGFGGAIRKTWQWLREFDTNEYILWLEDDFVISNPIDLLEMVGVLDARPDIAQLVLMRQPWSMAEKAAGGIMEQNPGEFTHESVGAHTVVTHRKFFSTNPSLFRRSLIMDWDWPEGHSSEGKFSIDLFASDPDIRSGYWAAGHQKCTHIGEQRIGNGY